MELDEIKNKTIRSIVALTGRSMLSQIITLLTLAPLGLFLSPSAFGTFIAVSAIIPFFNYFVDLGLGSALIQQSQEPSHEDLTTVFTIQLGIVLLLIAAGLMLTGWLTNFSHLTADGVNLYKVLLLVLFISSLKSIPSILLERGIAFERQIIPAIIEQIVYSVIVVFLAFKGYEVASYSWAFGVSAVVGLPIYYWLSPWRVSLGVSRDSAKRLFSYGILYQSKTFLSLIKDNLLTVFLSGLPQVGTYGLGQVGWWQRWAYSPYNFTVNSVTKVTFPTYSRVQAHSEKLRSGIERSLFGVSLLMFPLLTGMAVLINKLLFMLPKYQTWSPGLPSFYFFCAGAAVSSLSGILVNALDATGRVKTTLTLMILWILLIWPLTIVLVAAYGFNGVAAAPFFVALTIFVTIYLVKRVVAFNFLENIVGPAVAAVLMGGGMFFLGRVLPVNFLTFVLTALAGAIIYAGSIWLFAREKIMENARIIIRAYRR